jgi:RNA polymerase sigma-32 factor
MKKTNDSRKIKSKKVAKKEPVELEILDSEEREEDLADTDADFAAGDFDASDKDSEDLTSAQLPVPSVPAGVPAPADNLQRYLAEVRQYPLLNREEEEKLAKAYFESGDTDAAAKLVTSNLRLVVKIAMDHQRYWMKNLLDLIQEGNVGLMQAVQKFDPFRGIKFSYYASFWIKAYILKFIMDNWRLVRLGTTQSQRKLFYNLRKEKEKLRAKGITPGPKLLSAKLGVAEKDVVEMDQRLSSWELSLDAPVRPDSEDDHQSFMPDESSSAEDDLASDELRRLFHEQLMAFRNTLDNKEKDILDLRLLAENPITLNDLGEKHGISRERVRQIQVRLMKKLKTFLTEQIPDFEGQFSGLVAGD